MNIALWIIAGLLAAAFLARGVMKLFQPKEKLVASGVEFLEGFGAGSIKAIGAREAWVPWSDTARRTRPRAGSVRLAAVGLVVMVVGAIIVQLRRHETKAMVANLAMIAWPASWCGAASAPSPSPADPARRLRCGRDRL